ncbi:retrovirus-related pol polyprotein from transposon TNT 1-94 [Tanacetum coccineum]
MALLAQSFRATLPQTNNQLRTSSNTRNQETVQDGTIMVQNVQGRQNQNQNQRYFARGNGAAGNGGAHNRAGNANAGQGKLIKCYNCNGLGHIARNLLDEEELLFLAGEQANNFDADECDAFDSDVDDEPTAQSIFMANLSSARPANLQDRHEIHNEVQHAYVIDSTTVDMGNSNVILYEQYLSVNNVSVVPRCASYALNDACVLFNNDAYILHDHIATKLKIYKEQVAIYEQRAKFELTKREQRMDDQIRMLIQNRNKTEEYLKKELHSVKLQLNSTMENNKIIEEIVTVLKQEFKQKEKNFLTNFSNLKHLNDKLENKLHSQDQSIQIVHMMLNPTKVYDQKTKTAIEHFDGVQKSLVTEVRAMKVVFENLEAEVDQNEIDLKSSEIERKNLLIANVNLIAECLSKDVFYTITDSVINVSRFSDMHDAFSTAQKRIADFESKNINLRNKIQNDDHDSLIKHFSKLEVEHFNLQLKYQHLKECFGTIKPVTSSDAPSFDLLFVIGQLNEQIESRGNTIREFLEKISRLTKKNSDADPISDLKALVSQNKDLTAKLNALHDLNERFRAEIAKAQLKENSKCVTISDGKPKVLAPSRYPIDVEPIPPCHKNNREMHLYYIKRLKESVETLCEIVEEAKVERPLDISLASACCYTKHSQELLEHVIGTCSKDFNPRDKQNASTTLLRKKRVTFVEPYETSTHNTPAQVEHQKINSPNAPRIPSTGVKRASVASGSKPRSNTKKDMTLPAKSALKQVEAHSRMNKSNEKQKNHVDSSISYKRTVINSNSNTSCKTCNKCLISVNHDQCVVRSEVFIKQSPSTKFWRVKQVWQATRNFFTTIGHQWRTTGRLLPLGDQCPLTRKKSTALKSDCCSKHMTRDRSRLKNFVKRFIGTVLFKNDHFGAIMGYRDYVIGDSEISRVYYVEGLGHNLFSVGQFCDSNLEVAFRKHTCFVKDLDGVDLIKGSRGTNLYTISVEDMMRSSPIFLPSKASKNKGLPRLKFEKDHLCSACQLGKNRNATHKPKTINTIMEVLHTLHMDLCGPLRVHSINGKKYILVIVDDYSRFTWVKFLRSKDKTPAFVINLLKQLQIGLNKTVRFIQTDNGTEFIIKDLSDYYESIGITHEKTVLRTPQQNSIVERRNRTFVEAARTMLIFSKAPLFLWVKVVATVCYPKNRSLIHTLHDKTPYELVHDKKPDLLFLCVFGAL